MFELIDQLISYRTVHRVKEFFTACLMRILVHMFFGYVFYCRASESGYILQVCVHSSRYSL
jgi:hypothetical protein